MENFQIISCEMQVEKKTRVVNYQLPFDLYYIYSKLNTIILKILPLVINLFFISIKTFFFLLNFEAKWIRLTLLFKDVAPENTHSTWPS